MAMSRTDNHASAKASSCASLNCAPSWVALAPLPDWASAACGAVNASAAAAAAAMAKCLRLIGWLLVGVAASQTHAPRRVKGGAPPASCALFAGAAKSLFRRR